MQRCSRVARTVRLAKRSGARAAPQTTKIETTVCTLPEETVTVTVPVFPFVVSTAVDPLLDVIVPRLLGVADHVSAGVAIVLPLESTARTVRVTVEFV